jgi:hypothetical protein
MPHFRKAHTLSAQSQLEPAAAPPPDTASEVMVRRCKALLEKPPTVWRASFCVEY